MLQLEGYENEEYKKWSNDHMDQLQRLIYTKTSEKSPLVMTDRAKRLYNLTNSINIIYIFVGVLIRLVFAFIPLWPTVLFVLYCGFLYLFQYRIILQANAIRAPKEAAINMGFYRDAQRKIASLKEQNQLEVVGITGSFGKTSVKFIANTILSQEFVVQNTPSSYNTPMGLSKIINNELSTDHEVFLAELGAKKIGEIEEVAQLVQPTIGIITAVGPTHMHLFHSIANIQRTKYELIEALADDGVAIFNYDNEYVRPLADKTTQKTLRYGLEDVELLDVYATDLKVGALGSDFTLHIKEHGSWPTHTRLLGEHNIQNLLAAAAAAYALGMGGQAIAKAIEKVEPVEHRLNIVDGGTGVIVIDDAFNSNPVGARAALKVLDAFDTGKKIIVTPGMVELGAMEEDENRKLGREIAQVADIAILVGPQRTKPIQEGLREEGYPEEKIHVVKSLDEATQTLAGLTAKGDVVLFENDLPDNYDEV
ncbi:MAG: UDP-N-acetylmuramoyl-tripeptide--D-alanyl-D-alanine ligase [Tissierellia bacterium]|nr:UDP-N-acetylmuramoyl-tripeptide--D-alanyl-D-alanine ligase [Tissierellia bacterium]